MIYVGHANSAGIRALTTVYSINRLEGGDTIFSDIWLPHIKKNKYVLLLCFCFCILGTFSLHIFDYFFRHLHLLYRKLNQYNHIFSFFKQIDTNILRFY
jgi:hypothetical protein